MLPKTYLFNKKERVRPHPHSRAVLLLPALLFLLAAVGCSGNRGAASLSSYEGVLLPVHDGGEVTGNEAVSIDISHIDDGYFMACYQGSSEKVKMQLTGPDAITYTYDLPLDGTWDAFPFTAGDGAYTLMVYECLEGDQYFTSFAQELEVELSDELLPFLYPNQFVNFTEDTKAVAKAKELTADCSEDLDKIRAVYEFTTNTITYDAEKAATVTSGYLPDVDETLETKTGICFDYAALMTCMLRSLGIPTKLQIGFSGDVKHAWISTYLSDTGWAENIIRYDGTGWAMMDPTFDSEMDEKEMEAYIGDGTNYTLQYSR